jgi:hypothetical protein
MTMKRTALVLVTLLIGGGAVFAQAPNPTQAPLDMVEVEPIKCWWRTSTSAVRTGESFTLTLTCAVVETDQNKVVADFSKLDPTVVTLPPFEVLGGTHAGDLVVPGRRFFQYDYRMRLIAEDAFGNDVSIPPLEVSYRIESQVAGGDTVQGREQSYTLPRTSVRLISLVPDDTTDIRESPAAPFTAIESRDSRAGILQTAATILFGLAAVLGIVMLISMLRRKAPKSVTASTHLHPRTILSAVARELNDVQQASRGGWTQELAGRALAAARISGAYAMGRSIGQRPAGKETPVDGVLVVRAFGKGEVWVSGGATTQASTAVPGLSDALRALTAGRYGRTEKFDSTADEAVATAIRITKEQQSAHSLVKEWGRAFVANIVDLRKKLWA